MTIADTSAWIELLRGHSAPVKSRLAELIKTEQIAIVEPVAMELLAGARTRAEERATQKLILGVHLFRLGGLPAWEDAASIFRRCRAGGVTPRSHLDCLIAAVAIREGVEVLHADRDFDLIAQHTPLRIAPV